MDTFANSVDQDKMLHDGAFHQGNTVTVSKSNTIFKEGNTVLFGSYNV